MSGDRRGFSPVDKGFVRIEKQPDGLHRVTVLRSPDGTEESDIVSIHLRCKKVSVERGVRLVNSGDAITRSEAPVVVYQSYETKTVVISASPAS
jgi:hypothetical protein